MHNAVSILLPALFGVLRAQSRQSRVWNHLVKMHGIRRKTACNLANGEYGTHIKAPCALSVFDGVRITTAKRKTPLLFRF